MSDNVLCGVVGSHAYGCATPESDVDYMNVFVAPLDHYFGIQKETESKQTNDGENDVSSYEFRNFVSLCAKFNPNVIPMLFLDAPKNWYEVLKPNLSAWRFVHPVMVPIIQNRSTFISKSAAATLIGYADGMISRAKIGVSGKWGEKRKALVEEYGYDVKAAAHAYRLLSLGKSIFCNDHGVNIQAGKETCSFIRNGNVAFDDFLEIIEEERSILQILIDRDVFIPEKPETGRINRMCVNAIKEYEFEWRGKG
jgi:hypothetical protein